MLSDYLPSQVNSGKWVTAYTLPELRQLPGHTEFVLPICSLTTPYSELQRLGQWLLPPLFSEALLPPLKDQVVERIMQCFPIYGDRDGNARRLKIAEVETSANATLDQAEILALSVDTAVEEHGPHLPLATDTIQSYGVLQLLAQEFSHIQLGRPLEYGQLTWGLPFGFSVDLTAELLTEYVAGFARCVAEQSGALYVVDVHGSIVHREAIVEGLRRSGVERWAFRWLHEPLAEFASARGDQHAGGVETAIVEHVNPQLLDAAWWPDQMELLKARQMSFTQAVELTPTLDRFMEYVEATECNGIVGRIENYQQVNAHEMMQRMMDVARADVQRLTDGDDSPATAGASLW